MSAGSKPQTLPLDDQSRAVLAQAASLAAHGRTDADDATPVVVSGRHLLDALEAGVPGVAVTVVPGARTTAQVNAVLAASTRIAHEAGASAITPDHLRAGVADLFAAAGINADALMATRALVRQNH
ncbi:MAG: hypothetical protein NTV35_09350 [Chloroflexi bacterium]|jgi:hypothetical protein|nr:hypothetical protein [Chloroflexota bacterium]